MSKWSDSQPNDNATPASLQKLLKRKKPLTTNSNMRLSWHVTVITKPTKLVPFVGICVQRLVASSKEKLARLSRWFNISALNMTSKLWVLTNLCLKSNKRDKTFICRQNFACLLESLRKSEKTKRQWPLWDKVFSRNHMIESSLFANLMRWFQPAKRSNNGVWTSHYNPTQSKRKSWNDQKFSNRLTLQPKQPEEISILVKLQPSKLMAALLAHWTTLTTSTRWFMSRKCLKNSQFSV